MSLASTRRSATAPEPEAFTGFDAISAARDATQTCLCAPFDALRAQYAGAVRAGLVPRSLLASARFERSLDQLEKLCLGPLARQR